LLHRNLGDKAFGPSWPEPLSPDAFHGLAGDLVRVMEPVSESDPAALLIQALTVFGSVLGHGPYFQVENTRHSVNLFATLVGRTAKARKGTALDNIRSIFSDVDGHWDTNRVVSGLSSGEGVIEAVRDANAEGDEGVSDKRLLVVQGEFASVLSVMSREGNTLSSILRCAWDGQRLQTMTRKQTALRATDSHISIIGHITIEELRRHLNETEKANGFANRILWMLVARSKFLPEGATLSLAQATEISEKFRKAVDVARRAERMSRDTDARELWAAEYRRLSEGANGMFGAITSRAEAQVLRLSMLYALLDSSHIIRVPHLNAALEVWRYAEDSCRYIFGNALGDPVADVILGALREAPTGLTRTEISALFGRHKNAGQIDTGLNQLHELGKIGMRIEETAGRPSQRWALTRDLSQA